MHCLGDRRVQHDVSNDASLELDGVRRELLVQVLDHTLCMLVATEGVRLRGLHRSSDESDTLLDVCVDQLVILVDVRHQLHDFSLVVFKVVIVRVDRVLVDDLEHERKADVDVEVVGSDDPIVRALVDEVLLGHKVFCLGPREAEM